MSDDRKVKIIAFILSIINLFGVVPSLASYDEDNIIEEAEVVEEMEQKDKFETKNTSSEVLIEEIDENLKALEEKSQNDEKIEEDPKEEKIENSISKTDKPIKLIDIKNNIIIEEKKLINKDRAYAEDLEGYILISKDFYDVKEDEMIKFYYYPRSDNPNIQYTVIKHIGIIDGEEVEIRDKEFQQTIIGETWNDKKLKGENIIDRLEESEGNVNYIVNKYKLVDKYNIADNFQMEKKDDYKPLKKKGFMKLIDGKGNNLIKTKKIAENIYNDIKGFDAIEGVIGSMEGFDLIFRPVNDSKPNGEYKIQWTEEISLTEERIASVYVDLFMESKTFQEILTKGNYKLVSPNPIRTKLENGKENLIEFVFEKQKQYEINYQDKDSHKELAPKKIGWIGESIENENRKVTAKVIPGYKVFGEGSKEIKYSPRSDKLEIVFNYEKDTEKFEDKDKNWKIIRYEDEKGNSIYKTDIKLIDNNMDYEKLAKEILENKKNGPDDLYELSKTEHELIEEIINQLKDPEEEEVIIKYIQNKGIVNIHYIGRDTGLPVEKSERSRGNIYTEVDNSITTEKKIEGYTRDGENLDPIYRYGKKEQDIIIYYDRSEPENDKNSVTVHFLDDYNHHKALRDPVKIDKIGIFTLKEYFSGKNIEKLKCDGYDYYFKNKYTNDDMKNRLDESINVTENSNRDVILRYGRKLNVYSYHRTVHDNVDISKDKLGLIESESYPIEEEEVYQGDFGTYKNIKQRDYIGLDPWEQTFPVINNKEKVLFNYYSKEAVDIYRYKISFVENVNGEYEKISPDLIGQSTKPEVTVYARELLGYELITDNREKTLENMDIKKITEYKFIYRRSVDNSNYRIRFREVEEKNNDLIVHDVLADDITIFIDILPKDIIIDQDRLDQLIEKAGISSKLDNYELYRPPKDGIVLEKHIDKTNQTINIDYKKIKTKISIYHLNIATGEAVMEPEIKWVNISDGKYKAEAGEIEGFKLAEGIPSIKLLELGRENLEYIFYYENKTDLEKKTLIINHIDNHDKKVLKASETIYEDEAESNGNYIAKSKKEIKGYRLAERSDEETTVNFDEFELSEGKLKIVTFYYDKIIKYEIRHYDNENFEEISEREEEDGVREVLIQRKAKSIEDYKALDPKEQSLLLEDVDPIQKIIFKYEKIEKVPEEPGGGNKPEPKPPEPEPDPEPEPELPERPDWGGTLPPDMDLNNLEPEIVAKEINFTDHFNYIIGYPDETIRPENNVTREEVATIMLRIMNRDFIEAVNTTEHDYTDLVKDGWSERYIATMSRINVLKGYKDGRFKPRSDVTRAELAVLVVRVNDLSEDELNGLDSIFNDIEGHWAEDAINLAVDKNWIEGYEDGTYRPNESIKRSELVTLINNMLDRYTKLENMLDNRKEYKDLEKFRWYYEAMQEAITPHEYYREEDGEEIWTEIYKEVHDVFGVVTYKHDKKIKDYN